MTTSLIPQESQVLTQEEGEHQLALLQDEIAGHFSKSKDELNLGVIKLHYCRESGLFLFSGKQWKGWLADFLDENGISRSLAYDLLRVARIWTGGFGLPIDLLAEYGVYTIRPVIEDGVEDYDRATGEIKKVSTGMRNVLDEDGEAPIGHKVGEWVVKNLEAGTPATIVRDTMNDLTDKPKIMYDEVEDATGNLIDLGWRVIFPDGEEDGGGSLSDMLPVVRMDLRKRLRIKVED